MKLTKYLIIFIPLLFLTISITTLSDYGINWDEPFHFMRGQAYLHYFLTGGNKNYDTLPEYPRINTDCDFFKDIPCDFSPAGPLDRENYKENNLIYEEAIKLLYPKDSNIWRSYYQHDTYNFEQIIKTEGGHPAVGDISAAFFNYIFYQKLHILGDIESYHFFEVFVSFLIVLAVSIIVYLELGTLPAIISSISLAVYPLFFSESHFNIKDPPETAFFGLTIILFYLGITKNKWIYIILSSIVAAFAVGTKFNAFFIAPILGLWLLYYSFFIKFIKRNNKLIFISLLLYPFITMSLFYLLWPYLWNNSLDNFINILLFYKQIGTGIPAEMSQYIHYGWNTFPIIWIISTTPIPILALFFTGFLVSIKLSFFKKNSFAFLILIWFLVPILRSSFPNSSIYGGVRQFMEFLPAMAILAGIGANFLIKVTRYKYLMTIIIFSGLLFVTWEMIRIHPNQNVYFNQLIGGLSGAKDKNIPYWGNSYGNAYKQGIDWLNKNAEPNAKVGLPISTMGNIPWINFRSDLIFSNSSWSGPAKLGEYEIELDLNWTPKTWYSYAYYDNFLDPVYEVKVDGVAILKIWKNDIEHTKDNFKEEYQYQPKQIYYEKKLLGTDLRIDMGKDLFLTKLMIKHKITNCQNGLLGYVALSSDGKDWKQEVDPITGPQVAPGVENKTIGWSETNFVYLFAGKNARYIMLDPQTEDSCLLQDPDISVFGLKTLP